MTDHAFDEAYWERHWQADTAPGRAMQAPVNPYLPAETAGLDLGTALDAGCGTGTEALWLAAQGWQVTAADVSPAALTVAATRAEEAGLTSQLEWVHTDLTSWEPGRSWDLVVTNYAHPATGQLDFHRHIATWVAPGGTLLVVAHDHSGHGHPAHATATAAAIRELFTAPAWRIGAGYENTRTVEAGGGTVRLHDVVVRVHRTV
jgi:2-polyprenyl-3-methyl-5-hydroxy-6-metoxy-1,4-benzoquinol methylase